MALSPAYWQISHALRNGEFCLAFEPQVCHDMRVIGYELLIRWNHPQKGILLPKHFLPQAAAAGLTKKIDLWVFHQAILELGRNCRYNLAINFGHDTLNSPSLILDIKELISPCALRRLTAQGKLEIEIHETASLTQLARRNINLLHRMGCQIVLDDYGNGNSEIKKLTTLPISKIKIDRSLTSKYQDLKTIALIKSLASYCDQFAIAVCIEGISCRAKLEAFQALGFQLFQGYHLSDRFPYQGEKLPVPQSVPAVVGE